MEWIRWIFIFTFLTRVMITDIKDGVIENKVIVIALVIFWGFAGIADGPEGLVQGARMCGMTFGVLFLFYLIKGLGAGDVKMLCVLAILLPEEIWNVMLGAMVITAIYGVARMLKRGLSQETIYKKGETIPFSVPVGIATAGVLLKECII